MKPESNPLQRLVPDYETTTVASHVSGLEFEAPPGEERPFVMCNFAATVDGKAAIEGRSGPIAGPADSELLLGLRSRADAVMVGAGTLRAEKYGRMIADPEVRAKREEEGLSADPLAVIVSGRLQLPWEIPLFTEGAGKIVVFTSSDEEPPETETPLQVIRHEGGVDLTKALALLRREWDIEVLLCEGGPHLHGDLWREDLVDELFLTIGPRLAGGDAPGILSGDLRQPAELQLIGLLADEEGALMCRYVRVGSGG